jgi:arylsulfatase A-like enzyme
LSAFSSQAYSAGKPNIFIISMDSFTRKPELPKNFRTELMPNLNHFTDTGYMFKNCFTENSWEHMHLWLSKIPNKIYEQSGYELIGLGWKTHSLRRIEVEKNPELPLNIFMNLPAESHLFELGYDYLKEKFSQKRDKPFFLELHIKELHPPLYIEQKINISRLTPKSRELFLKYLNSPEETPDKVTFYSVLFDETLRQHHSPQVMKAINKLIKLKRLPRNILQLRFINLTIMDDLLELWKNSKGYKDDLVLMSELYYQRQTYLDSRLPELFSLFGNKELADNTLFIIVSSFGFAMMEHGQIFDAVGVYEEFIGTNLFVKPPHTNTFKVIQEQSSLRGIGRYTRSLLESKSPPPVHENLDYIFESEIISKNFNHDLFAIRENNTWKLHLDLVDSKRKLYDIKNDPHEKNDLYQQNLKIGADLETKLLKQLIKDEI